MKIHESIKLRIHAHGEEAWSMLHEAFESKQQISIGRRVFVAVNTSRNMEDGRIFGVAAMLSELTPVKVHSEPSDNQLITALRDCVNVMERELNGLAVIQTELRQAREALAAAEAKPEPWDGEGLPPVGVRCIVTPHNAQWGFDRVASYVCKVAGYHSERVWLITEAGSVITRADKVDFEIYRTPEQIAAEERLDRVHAIEGIMIRGQEQALTITQIAAAIEEAGYRKQVAP